MKFLPTDQQNLNEIIFANKNKSYGAYAIRASYNNSLLKALTIISSLLLLATGSMYVLNRGNEVIDKKQIDLPGIITTICDFIPPTDKPNIPDPPRSNPVSGQRSNVIGTVVTDSVADNNTTPTTNVTLQTTGTSTADVSDPSLNTSTISGTGTNTNTGTTSNEPFVLVEEMPEYEGGMNALLQFVGHNIVYPPNAREAGIEGTVYVSFVVDETGEVGSVKIEKGIGGGCNEESVRVVSKIPKFKKPGKNAGHFVKVRFNIPIKYKMAK